MIFTTDDVCPSNLKYFKYWKYVKEAIPELQLWCFVIAKNNEKEEEQVDKNNEFKEWYEENKDWIKIGLHGYDHDLTRQQEGWREDQKDYIKKSLDIIQPLYIQEDEIIYRPPGFRCLPFTERVLKDLDIDGIAYAEFIKRFADGSIDGPCFNTHCCDKYDNPITEVWKDLVQFSRQQNAIQNSRMSVVK